MNLESNRTEKTEGENKLKRKNSKSQICHASAEVVIKWFHDSQNHQWDEKKLKHFQLTHCFWILCHLKQMIFMNFYLSLLFDSENSPSYFFPGGSALIILIHLFSF